MPIGLVGYKCGMTRIFTKDGISLPVTVIKIDRNIVTQIKTADNDGYNAIQVTSGSQKRSRINKPESGHFARFQVEPGKGLWEFRADEISLSKYNAGDDVSIDIFKIGDKVDIQGISKGKGFQGVVKRHNFTMQDATHGNSRSHRVHGSTGQNQTPGRVFKNKKMAGHMGNVKSNIQNINIIKIDLLHNILAVKGGIPGSKGSYVIINHAVKR